MHAVHLASHCPPFARCFHTSDLQFTMLNFTSREEIHVSVCRLHSTDTKGQLASVFSPSRLLHAHRPWRVSEAPKMPPKRVDAPPRSRVSGKLQNLPSALIHGANMSLVFETSSSTSPSVPAVKLRRFRSRATSSSSTPTGQELRSPAAGLSLRRRTRSWRTRIPPSSTSLRAFSAVATYTAQETTM